MDKKSWKNALVAIVMAVITLITSFIAVSCGGKCNHDYGEWRTIVLKTCSLPEQQIRSCNKCKQEEYRTVGEPSGHEYSEWETIPSTACDKLTQLKRFCLNCAWEEYTYEGQIQSHSYLDWQYDVDENELYQSCKNCEKEIRLDFSKLYQTDGNGQVELVAIQKNRLVVKPVANDGYYFLKWEMTYDDENKDVYYSVLQHYPSESYVYKAIFTNDESLIQPVTFDIEVENNLEVDVEYLPYVNKENQKVSYYVHANENLVLSGDYSLVAPNNVISHVYADNVELLPYWQAYNGSFIGENNDLQLVTLRFSDIRDKYLLKLDEIGIEHEEIITVHDRDEKVIVNTKELGRTGIFESWQDKDGNVISTEEEFELILTNNTTIYLNVNNYDVLAKYNDYQFEFEISENDTLTLHDFSYQQFATIEIPSVVDGRTVTGIGLLHTSGFSGKLIIPDTVISIEPNAFKYFEATLSFSSERTDLQLSDFYGCSTYTKFDFSEAMIQSLATNELHKLAKDHVNVSIVFEVVMEEGVLGYYTSGTHNITVKKLQQNQYYNRNILNVLAHELRHYYQSICIGEVTGLGLSDVVAIPTDNQLGAWKYLDYIDPSEDYNKYYYNAREIDSREYAEKVVGFDLAA